MGKWEDTTFLSSLLLATFAWSRTVKRLPGTDPGGCHLRVLAFHPGSDTRSLWLLTSGAGVVLSCPG